MPSCDFLLLDTRVKFRVPASLFVLTSAESTKAPEVVVRSLLAPYSPHGRERLTPYESAERKLRLVRLLTPSATGCWAQPQPFMVVARRRWTPLAIARGKGELPPYYKAV